VKRPNLFNYPVALFLVLAALAVLPASAAAVVTSTAATGRVSYLPMNEGAGSKPQGPAGLTVPTGSPPLEWHGGPVMTSHEAFAIFWAPSGFSFPSGYKAAITEYLENVAADSGLSTNVYSVSAQYKGSNGHATYTDSFGGSVDDANAYPSSGTCPAYTGFHGVEYTACVSDAKLKAEVASVVASQEWPSGLGAEYYVVLPPQVGSCFGTTSTSGCFDKEFCAYHSFVSSPKLVYANISYSPGDVSGCGVGEYPNGKANGNVDDTLSSLSHEANESITDPELNAFFDEEGFENGDECRNTPFGEDYGAALGGGAETLFNESINGGHYYLQQEWSNDIEDCAQRVGPAKPAIANPGAIAPGQLVEFNGAGSVPGDGGIVSFEWEFGDGGNRRRRPSAAQLCRPRQIHRELDRDRRRRVHLLDLAPGRSHDAASFFSADSSAAPDSSAGRARHSGRRREGQGQERRRSAEADLQGRALLRRRQAARPRPDRPRSLQPWRRQVGRPAHQADQCRHRLALQVGRPAEGEPLWRRRPAPKRRFDAVRLGRCEKEAELRANWRV
jgi:hypothetical protein